MYHIGSTAVIHVVEWSTPSHYKATNSTRSLALSQTCKQFREEYSSLWISTVTVRVRLFQLEHYLQKLYLRHNTTQPYTDVYLLLPHSSERSSKILFMYGCYASVQDDGSERTLHMHRCPDFAGPGISFGRSARARRCSARCQSENRIRPRLDHLSAAVDAAGMMARRRRAYTFQ